MLGSNMLSQLGIDPEILSTNRPLDHPFFRNRKIIKVVTGRLHTLVLCENNELFSWGVNDDSALGRSGNEAFPEPVDFSHKIVDMCCGVSFSALLTDKGHVYACGTFKTSSGVFGFDSTTKFQNVFKRVGTLKNIKKIAAGENHMIMIDRDGNLWTMGANENGQLGRSHRERMKKRCLDPFQVSSKSQKPIIQLFVAAAGGSTHSMAINVEGECLGWGSNFNGQLGTGTCESSEKKALVMEGVDAVSCGRFHTVFLKEGKVYGCGDNTLSQVGVEGKRMFESPVFVVGNIDRVVAGSDFCIAQRGNRLLSWGSNMNGELGFDERVSDEIKTPREIDFDFGKITGICCGADFVLIHTE